MYDLIKGSSDGFLPRNLLNISFACKDEPFFKYVSRYLSPTPFNLLSLSKPTSLNASNRSNLRQTILWNNNLPFTIRSNISSGILWPFLFELIFFITCGTNKKRLRKKEVKKDGTEAISLMIIKFILNPPYSKNILEKKNQACNTKFLLIPYKAVMRSSLEISHFVNLNFTKKRNKKKPIATQYLKRFYTREALIQENSNMVKVLYSPRFLTFMFKYVFYTSSGIGPYIVYFKVTRQISVISRKFLKLVQILLNHSE
ncbi:hypothetical protein BpHYR1_003039 [Brachionus plicatilis]|uniref:Uncharacterized protein n=1 Tax=Brachionus plicatilis TaxID=10195 RepID=A0A3M7R0H1_BRAPC|nr:hypothetical protein BpHYR1_003039 [Brachionus plicatilis]